MSPGGIAGKSTPEAIWITIPAEATSSAATVTPSAGEEFLVFIECLPSESFRTQKFRNGAGHPVVRIVSISA